MWQELGTGTWLGETFCNFKWLEVAYVIGADGTREGMAEGGLGNLELKIETRGSEQGFYFWADKQ